MRPLWLCAPCAVCLPKTWYAPAAGDPQGRTPHPISKLPVEVPADLVLKLSSGVRFQADLHPREVAALPAVESTEYLVPSGSEPGALLCGAQVAGPQVRVLLCGAADVRAPRHIHEQRRGEPCRKCRRGVRACKQSRACSAHMLRHAQHTTPCAQVVVVHYLDNDPPEQGEYDYFDGGSPGITRLQYASRLHYDRAPREQKRMPWLAVLGVDSILFSAPIFPPPLAVRA